MNVYESTPRLQDTAPEVEEQALVQRAAHHLNDYRARGRAGDLAAAEDTARRIASLWHTATGTGGQTMWLQVARYAIELAACREQRNLTAEYEPSGLFGDGLPLEEMAPQAHSDILGASRRLAYHRRHVQPADYAQASALAERAAATLQQASRLGVPSVWLSVVRYLTELHAHTLGRE